MQQDEKITPKDNDQKYFNLLFEANFYATELKKTEGSDLF